MSAALRVTDSLPQEALDLIRAGTPKPLSVASDPKPEIIRAEAPTEQSEKPDVAAVAVVQPSESAPPNQAAQNDIAETKVTRSKPQKEKEAEALPISNALVSVTIRVPADLPSALVRASADRKARRVKPFTQQEIVAEAVSQWLKKNGY